MPDGPIAAEDTNWGPTAVTNAGLFQKPGGVEIRVDG
jgi:hypothetical protein